MRPESLFGEIVAGMHPHPENVATESLLYILRRYPAAWPSLRTFLKVTGAELPLGLAFKTQAYANQDEAIPDLVGVDSHGDQVLVVEAKFWAGLTPNQPAGYLRRLPLDKAGLVLLIAPGQRLYSLWAKLCEQCAAAHIDIGACSEGAAEFRFSRVRPFHSLGLASWRSVLGVLSQDAEVRGDRSMLGDVEQLHGLCARMDSDAFLPLVPRDLSREVGRRVQQFADLVDHVVAELARNHGASTKGLTTGGSQSAYGRYFVLAGLGFFFSYSPKLWARYGETPLWLHVSEPVEGGWRDSPWICERLRWAFAARPDRLCECDGRLHIAIELPLAVDRHEVLAHVVRQIKWVADRCKSALREPDENGYPVGQSPGVG